MSELAAGTGIKTKIGMEHRDGKGNLIYAEWTRESDRAVEYDKWRSIWCNKHRLDKTPEGLREGIINEENLIFAMSKGYKPVFNINQLVEFLNS